MPSRERCECLPCKCSRSGLFLLVFYAIIQSLILSCDWKTHYSQDSMGEVSSSLVQENQQPTGNGGNSPLCKIVACATVLGVRVLFRSWILVGSLSAHLQEMKANTLLWQNDNKNDYCSSLNTPYVLSMRAKKSYFYLLASIINLQPIRHLGCVHEFSWSQYEVSHLFLSSWNLLGIQVFHLTWKKLSYSDSTFPWGLLLMWSTSLQKPRVYLKLPILPKWMWYLGWGLVTSRQNWGDN